MVYVHRERFQDREKTGTEEKGKIITINKKEAAGYE